MTRDKRTGLRRPKNFLKMWADPCWRLHLTPRLHVGMVDEWLVVGTEGGRKSWYLALTQDGDDLLQTLGPVRGAPTTGKTLLLFEDDVVALARYLESSGLIQVNEEGHLDNGEAVEERERSSQAARRAKGSRRQQKPKAPTRKAHAARSSPRKP